MRVSFYTLGCKVNQYESNALAETFRARGDTVVPFGRDADAVVVNTCAVTEESEKKSRQIVHRAKKQNPDAVIVAVGCMTQADSTQIADSADIILGNGDKQSVVARIDEYIKNKKKICDIKEIRDCRIYENAFSGHGERTRATVKIEDGCDNFCAYCLIPYLRGPVRSRKPDDAMEEIRRLALEGYKEIVLTGIHLDSYGTDLCGVTPADLLEKIEQVDGIERVRLGSLEPVCMTEETVRRMMPLKKLCHQFHLSLQSGCDRTLKNMNRHYTAEEYKSAVLRLRNAFDDVAVTTDVIVGFPGETEEDFEASLAFVREIGFAKVHVFPYSVREGTAAADMKNQIAPDVKKQRTARMLTAAREAENAFLTSFVGKTVDVLFETSKNGFTAGYTGNYASVAVTENGDLHNSTYKVLVERVGGDRLFGTIIQSGGQNRGKKI